MEPQKCCETQAEGVTSNETEQIELTGFWVLKFVNMFSDLYDWHNKYLHDPLFDDFVGQHPINQILAV